MELVDRFRGSVLGLAIGDALGHPTEFISSVPRIKAKYGDKGIQDLQPQGMHPAGTFTDDTQMTISVARALVRAGHAPIDQLMTLMGQEFVAWASHSTNNRAPGGTCLAGCRNLRQGTPWREAGVKESKGCGAAMRAAPIGLFFYDDDDLLVRVSAASSVLTHGHPTAIASAVAAAAPVAWIMRGNGLDGMLEFTYAMVQKLTDDMVRSIGASPVEGGAFGVEQLDALDDTKAALASDDEDVCKLLGGAWVGEEAVACALWCVLKAKGSFEEALFRGANSSGDSDSIACIAGSIAGALVGVDGIRKDWVEKVERTRDLDLLARKLFAVKASGTDEPSIKGALDFFDAEQTLADAVAGDHDGDTQQEGDDPVEVRPISSLNVDELEAAVEKHNHLYWELASPVLTDMEFDKLTRRLKELKPGSAALLHLGQKPRERAVKHSEAMLSLDKCYEKVELERWSAEIHGDVVVMPKVDGLACSLRYGADGALEIAATRGDGEAGEDITPNARGIKDIPPRIAKGPLEVRGEVYMSLKEFEKHKAEKANPRNLAAGALRQKDPNKTRAMGLSFLAYGTRGDTLSTMKAKLESLFELGFRPIDIEIGPAKAAFDVVDKMARRKGELGYETDGVVVVANETSEHARLGATAHHPRWAIAWKFQGEAGESVLRAVEWSVARTGTITPVAIVDPVALSGVTVTRATLHHKGQVEKLGLTIGARLEMVRRGGVIPHVERVLVAGQKEIEYPIECPACGAAVVEKGDFLMCSKPADCQSAKVGRIIHFLDAVGVMGMGEAIVEEAIQNKLLETPADLFRLTHPKLSQLEKCGDKNAAKIIGEIHKAKDVPLDVLLRALGIDGLGKTAAQKLAEQFGALAKVRAATAGELSAMKGVGEVSARAIADGLKANAALLDDLLTFMKVKNPVASVAGPLTGKSFVFTGALSIDRKAAETRVKRLGGAVPSSVTKALTHLVVGGSGRDAPSTKQKAAEKLVTEGAVIEILDEAAFLALMKPLEVETEPGPPALIAVVDARPAPPAPPAHASTPPIAAAGPQAAADGDAGAAAPDADAAPAKPKKQLTLF